MIEELKIDYAALLDEVSRLNDAMEVFRPYSNKYCTKIANSLDEGNSDFITEVQKTLGNMSDTTAPLLIFELEDIGKKIHDIATSFAEADVELANTIGQNAEE